MASHQHPDTLANALAWAEDAACRGYDLDMFFTDSKGGVARAKRICAGCPVREECLDEGLRAEDGSRYGIYGGLTPDERTELVGSHAAAPKPKPRTGGKPLAPCGTRGAYDRHKRLGEPVDEVCAEAYAAFRREQREKAACGTRSGYQRHRKNGEQACDPCRVANTAADRRLRTTGSTKAPT